MTGGQACPCPIGTAPAQTHHVQTWAHSAFPHFKRNWKSECCATFPGYREVAWKTKHPVLVGFAQWCSALAQHIFLPDCVSPILSFSFKDFFFFNVNPLLNLFQHRFCFTFWCFGPQAWEVLAPWPRIKPAPSCTERQSPNYWTTGDILLVLNFKSKSEMSAGICKRSSRHVKGVWSVSHWCCNKLPLTSWLEQCTFIILQKTGMGLTGLKSSCQPATFCSGGSRRESIFLSIPASRSAHIPYTTAPILVFKDSNGSSEQISQLCLKRFCAF